MKFNLKKSVDNDFNFLMDDLRKQQLRINLENGSYMEKAVNSLADKILMTNTRKKIREDFK